MLGFCFFWGFFGGGGGGVFLQMKNLTQAVAWLWFSPAFLPRISNSAAVEFGSADALQRQPGTRGTASTV